MTSLLRKLALAGAIALGASQAFAQARLPSGYLMGNSGALEGPARPDSLANYLDRIFGNTSDKLIYRGASSWVTATVTSFARTLLDDTSASAARTTMGLVIGTDVQAFDADLTALAGLTSANNKCFYFTGSGTAATYDCSSFGRTLANVADAAAGRTALGLVISTDVQPFDADLTALAGLTSANNKCFYFTGSGTAATYDCSSFGRSIANVADASALRTLVGLVIGTDVQGYDSDLGALAANSTNGIWARTAAGTGAARTVTGTANEIAVTNGDGVSGNPTISLPNAITATGKTLTGGTFTSSALNGTTEVQQAVTISGDITPTQITANQNDYAPSGFSTATVLRISTDASRDITGLAGGADGRLIYIYNVGSQNAVLKNASGSSTAANRFDFGADLTLTPSQGASLIYDSTASRWRQVGGPSGSGGGSGTVTSIAPGAGLQNAGTTSAITASGTLSLDGAFGFRNRLINPNGKIWQRANSGAAAITDVTYAFDRWYGLTQSNGVTASQVTNAENGTPNMMRLTQANASAQRFGLAQVVESENAIDLRGQSVCASARVRMSASTTLRYAIVEWTGTADTVTKDFVNDWTSGTFTTGNFFTSTSTTITVTGSTALTANTLTTVSACGPVGSSMNNIAVIYWTDSTQAQNVTLDIGKAQLEQGLQATPLAVRSADSEWSSCQRYFYNGVPAVIGVEFNSTSVSRFIAKHPVRMRAVPSITLTSNFQVFDGTQTITITGVTNYSDINGLNFDASASSYTSSAGRAASVALNSGGNLNVDAEL